MRRYADALFRNWGLAIIPILILPLGAFLLLSPKPTIYGTANIWADPQSIQQLSYVNPNIPPADNFVSYVNQLLLSQSFDTRVARQSHKYWHSLTEKPFPTDAAATDLSKNAQASNSGPTFVTISYAGSTGPIVVEVIRSILREVSREIAQFNHQQLQKSTTYQKRQLLAARSRYSAAAKKLSSYMKSHHVRAADLAVRQLSDPHLAALYQSVQSSQTDVDTVNQQLSKLSSAGGTGTSLRVIDPPSSKYVYVSKKKQLTNLAIPLFLGLLLSGTFIVVRVALDRSLRYPSEVPEQLGLPVLAVIPYTSALAGTHTPESPTTAFLRKRRA